MAIQFEFYCTPITVGTNSKRYYPRLVNFQHVDTKKLSNEIHQRCTLTEADIRSVLVALSDTLGEHLREGHRIHVEGLGYFQVTLQGPETCDPKATRAGSIRIKTVRFQPDKELKMKLECTEFKRSERRPHSKLWKEEQLDQKIMEYLATEKFLTRRCLQSLCQLTQTTAIRHIKRLLEEKKIRNAGTRYQPIYVLNEP